jgi:penicillin amidase
MRMVVDLGDPKASRFEQPGGQSGHVLSPHYEDQFNAWVTGNGTPLEPGPTVVTDLLVPHA